MLSDKETLEVKFESKRKAFKEIEATLTKKHTEIEKQNAILSEKMHNIESKTMDTEGKYEEEVRDLKESLNIMGESVNKEREVFMMENEKLKGQNGELERELSDVGSSYERDKALWEGKF